MARRQRQRIRSGASELNPARVGREPRGAALHGPRISITCACGHHESVRYGENWTCPGCGKTWDTSRIPREEYAAIRRTQLRFRMLPVALGLLVVGLAAFFTLTGSPVSVVLLLPVVLIGWFVFLRGPHRRRYRRAIATRQRKWTLRGNL